MAPKIDFATLDSKEAAPHTRELADLYAEVHREPPYEWGEEEAELFVLQFGGQRHQDGFSLVEARDEGHIIGIGFGVTLLPNTPWWQNLVEPVSKEVTHEFPNRTFAVLDLLVRAPWRRRHVAEEIHDRLLSNRIEERATLTVLPAAKPAQAAFQRWGWEKVAQKRNLLPGSPVYDVMVKRLNGVDSGR
jgi:hypothetical protein